MQTAILFEAYKNGVITVDQLNEALNKSGAFPNLQFASELRVPDEEEV